LSLDVDVVADGVRVPLARQRVADLARAQLACPWVGDGAETV
jgi:hypothetical protein